MINKFFLINQIAKLSSITWSPSESSSSKLEELLRRPFLVLTSVVSGAVVVVLPEIVFMGRVAGYNEK